MKYHINLNSYESNLKQIYDKVREAEKEVLLSKGDEILISGVNEYVLENLELPFEMVINNGTKLVPGAEEIYYIKAAGKRLREKGISLKLEKKKDSVQLF